MLPPLPGAEVEARRIAEMLGATALTGIAAAKQHVLASLRSRVADILYFATHDAGIIGLARASQLAGVPRVIVSLWNVDDAATTEVMTVFAQEALADTPNNALQATIRHVRERFPDPKVWAAFVLFGSVR